MMKHLTSLLSLIPTKNLNGINHFLAIYHITKYKKKKQIAEEEIDAEITLNKPN